MSVSLTISPAELSAIVLEETKRVVVSIASKILLERASIAAHKAEPRARQAIRGLVRSMVNDRLVHSITAETTRSVAFAQRIETGPPGMLDQIGAALGVARRGPGVPPAPLNPDSPTDDERAAINAAHDRYRDDLRAANELEAQPFRAALGDALEAALDGVLAANSGVVRDLLDEIEADLEDTADVDPNDLLRKRGPQN